MLAAQLPSRACHFQHHPCFCCSLVPSSWFCLRVSFVCACGRPVHGPGFLWAECWEMPFSAQGPSWAILSTVLAPGLSPFKPSFLMQRRMHQKSASSAKRRRRTGRLSESSLFVLLRRLFLVPVHFLLVPIRLCHSFC